MTWAKQYLDGMTIEQIALEANVAPVTVRNHLHGQGVPMRKPGERPGVDRRPGPRSGDVHAPRDPDARIVRPSVQRMYR